MSLVSHHHHPISPHSVRKACLTPKPIRLHPQPDPTLPCPTHTYHIAYTYPNLYPALLILSPYTHTLLYSGLPTLYPTTTISHTTLPYNTYSNPACLNNGCRNSTHRNNAGIPDKVGMQGRETLDRSRLLGLFPMPYLNLSHPSISYPALIYHTIPNPTLFFPTQPTYILNLRYPTPPLLLLL